MTKVLNLVSLLEWVVEVYCFLSIVVYSQVFKRMCFFYLLVQFPCHSPSARTNNRTVIFDIINHLRILPRSPDRSKIWFIYCCHHNLVIRHILSIVVLRAEPHLTPDNADLTKYPPKHSYSTLCYTGSALSLYD
jgi:hypothetical protein